MNIGTGVSGLTQSTLPRRQRYGSNAGVFNVNLFQSTPPRRQRFSFDAETNGLWGFQSTPPRRQRFGAHAIKSDHCHFNPRHRAGSDSKNTQTSSLHLVYNIILFSYLQLISTDSSHSPPPLLPIFSPTTSANLPINPCSLSIRTGNSAYTYT